MSAGPARPDANVEGLLLELQAIPAQNPKQRIKLAQILPNIYGASLMIRKRMISHPTDLSDRFKYRSILRD
jgi:hypothetical protein